MTYRVGITSTSFEIPTHDCPPGEVIQFHLDNRTEPADVHWQEDLFDPGTPNPIKVTREESPEHRATHRPGTYCISTKPCTDKPRDSITGHIKVGTGNEEDSPA